MLPLSKGPGNPYVCTFNVVEPADNIPGLKLHEISSIGLIICFFFFFVFIQFLMVSMNFEAVGG